MDVEMFLMVVSSWNYIGDFFLKLCLHKKFVMDHLDAVGFHVEYSSRWWRVVSRCCITEAVIMAENGLLIDNDAVITDWLLVLLHSVTVNTVTDHYAAVCNLNIHPSVPSIDW